MEERNTQNKNTPTSGNFTHQNNKDFLKYKSYCKLLGISESNAKSLESYNKVSSKLTIYLISDNKVVGGV